MRSAEAVIPREGVRRLAASGISLYRTEARIRERKVFLRPGILIGIQGKIALSINDNVNIIEPGRFSVSCVGLPARALMDEISLEPLVLLHVDLNGLAAIETRTKVGQGVVASKSTLSCQVSRDMTTDLKDVVHRILELFHCESPSSLIASQLTRELQSRILQNTGPCLLVGPDQSSVKGRLLSTIENLSNEAVSIQKLAELSRMSLSSYHSHFKALFGCTPLEYRKAFRLHAALALLKRDGATITGVGRTVGYQSPSQFSREFRRYFGWTAREHLKVLNQTLHGLE